MINRETLRNRLCELVENEKKEEQLLAEFRFESIFLSDPGVPGVRSMGPVSLTHSKTFLKLNWCDSGLWRYQVNTNW